jgi:broad specificity phosphatase PhoE
MSTIYLVRHGITPANRENRFAGRSSEPLLAEGIEQIRGVGGRLRHKNIAAIYCGPAKRTMQSAAILGELLQAPFSCLAELDEINIPHWEGLTKDEIRQQYGSQYPDWLSAPDSFSLPGCETLEQVQKRAAGAVTGLLSDHRSRNLLLVSHLIVLRCLILYFQKRGMRDFRTVNIDNGAIIEISPGKGGIAVTFLQTPDP